jgi:cell division protein FtsA
LTQLANVEGAIDVPSIGDRGPRKISMQNLAEIIEPRYEELLMLVQSELRRSGYEELIAAGIVLTGGSSKVTGLIELAEEIFHMPVRMGIPQNVMGLPEVVRNPIYSTGIGLLIYGKEHQSYGRNIESEGTSWWSKIKNWFQGNF